MVVWVNSTEELEMTPFGLPSLPPGGARFYGTPKIINPLIIHNTTQFKKSKSTENIVAFSSILLSTFYVS
jgi:hypothetical protein